MVKALMALPLKKEIFFLWLPLVRERARFVRYHRLYIHDLFMVHLYILCLFMVHLCILYLLLVHPLSIIGPSMHP